MTTVESVCNSALVAIGYPKPIASIWEGSRAARAALEVYRPVRDGLLSSAEWGFALRELALATAVGAGTVRGFAFAYLFPTDALVIRNLIPTVLPADPEPVRWLEYSDPTVGRTIYSNLGTARCLFTSRVIDTNAWDNVFLDLMIEALARALAVQLGKPVTRAAPRDDGGEGGANN